MDKIEDTTEGIDENVQQENNTGEQIQPLLNHAKYISGMYQNWFLEYASYVILERAVPHISDGLKPVQRRILHSMKQLDDGRYNKVANIIGHTMQYHPHGDASIGDAMVQLGQKELLIDAQGNWGNIYTGDNAAAPRYIEARLSKFALDIAFNNKTTFWKSSYDGRNKEPINLPMKFPLLLAQGVEGIAVGLASKILPHNFNELIDAAILHLQNKDFELLPDFPTGGFADVSKYNDGLRGGKVRVRAKITKFDKKALIINDVPFGKTTGSLIDSILLANEKGKIKIKKIDDNTAAQVEVVVHLFPGVSSDKTIDALYAFTDCEISISPNSCVILNDKPIFIGVKDILKNNVQSTVDILNLELKIRLEELEDAWHFSSLEKIFIENRIYLAIEECETWEAIIEAIDNGLKPFKKLFRREITNDDIIQLTEIKIKRISKFNSFKADDEIKAIESELEQVRYNLANIIPYTIKWYKKLKEKYGSDKPRKTELRNFDTIEAAKVIVANEKLYVNYEEGFAGTGLKKDLYVSDCSDIDDIIVFRKDGTYVITKIAEKLFVGKNIIHIAVFKRNDERTIYNVAYRDGETGIVFAKRFAVTGITRDKEYNLTKTGSNSRVVYFSANPNGEAETLKVLLKPRPRLRKLNFEFDFSEIAIKGRAAAGNILTKYSIHKIYMKQKGVSTLGGRNIWFDFDVMRLNSEERGNYLGEFVGDDKILVINKNGFFDLKTFELSNHFDNSIHRIEKFDEEKIFAAIYFDASFNFFYLKRFPIGITDKTDSLIGEHPESKLIDTTDKKYARVEITFGGQDSHRAKEIVDVESYIGVKSYKARGKRLTVYNVAEVKFIEPIVSEEEIRKYESERNRNEPEFEIIKRNTVQTALDF